MRTEAAIPVKNDEMTHIRRGGFAPVAGMLINKRVVEAFHQGSGAFIHGQTYQGHPVACAAALKVQQVIKEERLLDNIKAMGNLLQRLLVEKLAEHPNVGNIRGRGLFWGVSQLCESSRNFDFAYLQVFRSNLSETSARNSPLKQDWVLRTASTPWPYSPSTQFLYIQVKAHAMACKETIYCWPLPTM